MKFANQWYLIWLYLMTSKFFPMRAPTKNLSFWTCLIFGECPRAAEWHSLVLQSEGSVELSSSKLLRYAKNTCLATGLEFNTSSGNMSIKNSSCKWLGFSKISYCKWCNWKRRTSKYFTEKLMFLYWIPYLSIYLRNLGKIT